MTVTSKMARLFVALPDAETAREYIRNIDQQGGDLERRIAALEEDLDSLEQQHARLMSQRARIEEYIDALGDPETVETLRLVAYANSPNQQRFNVTGGGK